MTIPTPTSVNEGASLGEKYTHSGEGKPSELIRTLREALYRLRNKTSHAEGANPMWAEWPHAEDAIRKADAYLARELERKHEQSEPVARDREADRKRFPDPAFNEWLDVGISDSGHTVWCSITNIEEAWAGWSSRPYYAPPPSEQAGISDEVLEIAEGKFDSVYEAQYFLDGTTDNKRAALAEVLKWYESAFPRGVAGGGELERDAVDLATYRWLREHSRFCNDSLRELWFDQCVEADGPEFDRAVHAAIAEHSRGRGVE